MPIEKLAGGSIALALGSWLNPNLPMRGKKTKGQLEEDLRRAVERAERKKK